MIDAQTTLKLQTGMIFANPVPKDKEANPEVVRKAIDQSLQEAKE